MFIFLLRQIDYFYRESEYLLVIKFCSVSLFINVVIFFYLTATFKNIDTKPGPQGPSGNRGERGLEGRPDICQTCDTQENTVGYEFLQDKFENQIIIEKPLIPPQSAEKDPWKDILGKRVKIFTKKDDAICGLQWGKRLAGLSILKGSNKTALLDCKGNSDIFTITKVGNNYYIQNILGRSIEEKGPHKKDKKATTKCKLSMSKTAGGTPFTRGSEHLGLFDCSEAQPIYIRGTPDSFRILIVNENEFICEATSSAPAGQLEGLEAYERLLKFNCIDEGEKFYLEVV